MTNPQLLCRQVRSRSKENEAAILALSGQHLVAPLVGLLRQELDSMIRVIYLLSITDEARREELIDACVMGKEWVHRNGKRITDAEMVRLANKLHGWSNSVYRFGCAFIHLSRFHDYLARDPYAALPPEEQSAILQHLRYYHGGPMSEKPSFQDIVPFLPNVFNKISSNLLCYIEKLERGESLNDSEEN